MSSTVGPYKPSEMEPMELKQPQTLEEDDEEEEEGPPSPLSAVHGVTISLDSLKNGNLQLLKEYGDENDVDVNGTVTPPDDYPPDSTFPEHADNASVWEVHQSFASRYIWSVVNDVALGVYKCITISFQCCIVVLIIILMFSQNYMEFTSKRITIR